MKISRRDFVARTSVSAVGLSLFPSIGLNSFRPQPESAFDCVFLDLQSDCVLRESLQGYRVALADDGASFSTVRSASPLPHRLAIVPGAGLLHRATAQLLLSLLQAGTHVLLESAAAFLPPEQFAAQQRILHRYFGLSIKPPVHLWAETSGNNVSSPSSRGKTEEVRISIPYIHYTWPRQTTVRDFSRIIPVASNDEDVIGRVDQLPVGLKKRLWNGILMFLGSPLGPALLAGDPQARSWLRSVTTL